LQRGFETKKIGMRLRCRILQKEVFEALRAAKINFDREKLSPNKIFAKILLRNRLGP